VRFPEELEQLASSVSNVSVHVTEPYTWKKTELPFLDSLAMAKKQDALARIEQVLRETFPEFGLEKESSRCVIVISSKSLLQYFLKRIQEEF
jgi:hypothetical protein